MNEDNRFTDDEICKIAWTILYHDIGVLEKRSLKDLLEEEFEREEALFSHAEYGSLFIKYFSPFHEYYPIVKYHHSNYMEFCNIDLEEKLKDVIIMMQVLDAIDICSAYDETLDIRKIEFDMHKTEPMKEVKQYYLNREKQLTQSQMEQSLIEFLRKMKLTQLQKYQLLKILLYSFDFKSRCTAIHFTTVVKISSILARLCQVDETTYKNICIGALLHDIGKIAIPYEILESKGKLNEEEWQIMKSYVLITEKLLKGNVDEEILQIAIRHHETLDGQGYPYGIDGSQLTLPQRIVAVADIISALCQERSYKPALSLEEICTILNTMCQNHKICPNVLQQFLEHKDEIYREILNETKKTNQLYIIINEEYEKSMREKKNRTAWKFFAKEIV